MSLLSIIYMGDLNGTLVAAIQCLYISRVTKNA